MGVIHGSATRDAIANLVDDQCNAGSGAAKLKIRDGSTVLATITLADPAHGAASGGVIALAGLPKSDTSADNTGEADNFLVTDSDDNTVYTGSVGDGAGDLSLDNTDINAGQTVTITAGGYTVPV